MDIKRADWVTVEGSDIVGTVKRVALDGSWADVNWHPHTKRMPTQFLHVQTTITSGDDEVTDMTRQKELSLKLILGMKTQEDINQQPEPSSSFTPVDSVSSIVKDLRAAGYAVNSFGDSFSVDMPDEEYIKFMAARGFVRDID